MLQQGDLSSASMDSLSYDSSVTSPASSTGHHNQRSKRMRTSFKHHQLRTMKTYFAINQNPDAKDLKQLAQKTGLSKRVLQVNYIDFPVSSILLFCGLGLFYKCNIFLGVVSKCKSKVEAKYNATGGITKRWRHRQQQQRSTSTRRNKPTYWQWRYISPNFSGRNPSSYTFWQLANS